MIARINKKRACDIMTGRIIASKMQFEMLNTFISFPPTSATRINDLYHEVKSVQYFFWFRFLGLLSISHKFTMQGRTAIELGSPEYLKSKKN